ncbi:MAG: cyclic nucleotide-binding domain-containing protein, partial [Bacteroidales bacterium]
MSFDAQAFLDSAGIAKRVVEFPAHTVIFSQGDPCGTVMYLQKGGVQLSVVSETGKQAIVATLGPGEFFGEGALAG